MVDQPDRERPLAEVDETAARIQRSSQAEGRDFLQEFASSGRRIMQRLLEDPSWRNALILTIVGVVLTNLVLMARPRRRTREEVILDRSREALDRSRETLDRAVDRLGAWLDR